MRTFSTKSLEIQIAISLLLTINSFNKSPLDKSAVLYLAFVSTAVYSFQPKTIEILCTAKLAKNILKILSVYVLLDKGWQLDYLVLEMLTFGLTNLNPIQVLQISRYCCQDEVTNSVMDSKAIFVELTSRRNLNRNLNFKICLFMFCSTRVDNLAIYRVVNCNCRGFGILVDANIDELSMDKCCNVIKPIKPATL